MPERDVAVVIPCFNSGAYLREAVTSALNQTYTRLTVIVVDDGSTDARTLHELDDIASIDRVRVIHTANHGLPAARNTGVAASTCDYFIPLDADDIILPSYVERAVRILDEDDSIGIVYCQAAFLSEVVTPWRLPEFSWPLMLVNTIIFSCCLFRKDDWISCGGYDTELVRGREDHDFNLRILSLGRAVYRIDKTLFYYRQHGDSLKDHVTNDRENLIAASARIFRNNTQLYAEHAEDLFTRIYSDIDAKNDLYYRYRYLEAIRTGSPAVWAVARGAMRRIHALKEFYRTRTLRRRLARNTGRR